MKTKILLKLLCLGLVMASCTKTNNQDNKPTSDPIIKSWNFSWTVTFYSGHDAIGCPGCFTPNPVPPYTWIHIPCWAWGNNCTHTFTIGWSPNKSTNDQPLLGVPYNSILVSSTETFSDSIIPMPARSFDPRVTNCNYWINIPAQNLHKVPNTNNQFYVSSFFFTTSAAYINK
jgi:hypothetical protein